MRNDEPAGGSMSESARSMKRVMVGTIVGEEQQMRHCFNYDSRGHLNVNCPTKNLGTKCRKYKHIASNCPKKDNLAKKILFRRFHINRKKYTKDVRIGDRVIITLIDMGSDICELVIVYSSI